MKGKWLGLLAGWLAVATLVACGGQAASPLSAEKVAEPEVVALETQPVTTPLATEAPAPTPTPVSVAPTPSPVAVLGPPVQVTQEVTGVVSPTIPTPSDPTLQKLVSRAKEDLARRLSIATEQIALIEVKAVEWSDASLGCPQPGVMYAQVITPGYRVVLQAKGETYAYHTDQGRVVILCESASSSGMPSKGEDATVDDGWPNQPLGDDVIIAPPPKRK